MSRGLGKLQRTLLAYIDQLDDVCTARSCVDHLTGGRAPTRAERSSVSRALVGLHRAGLIKDVGLIEIAPPWDRRFTWAWCSVAFAERQATDPAVAERLKKIERQVPPWARGRHKR
jgi:hypothetical protein